MPVVVIGPPVKPVPVDTLVTDPLPVPGVNPKAVVTSALERVTFPVRVLKAVTPALVKVTLAFNLPPPVRPVPART